MPFTAAHPAIVLPLKLLKRKWFSTTGLIIGSIAPDFGYFLGFLTENRISSHDLKDILAFNLPVTIFLAVLFHGLVRDNLIQNLPPFLRSRAEAAKGANWFRYLRQHWLVFLVSATIGIFSHLFWDSFTHYDTYFVERIEWLDKPVNVFGITLAVRRVIQHVSTLAGLAFIILYTLRMPTYPVPSSRSWIWYWLLVLMIGINMLLAYFPEVLIMQTIDEVVVRFLTGCLVAILLFGVISKLKELLPGSKIRS